MPGSALYGPWKAPFKYDDMGCWIVDANGKRVLDLRGWGYLTGTGCGGLRMTQEAACVIQDRVGRRVVELLNEDFGDHEPPNAPDVPGQWIAEHETTGEREWAANVTAVEGGRLVALMACNIEPFPIEVLAASGWRNWKFKQNNPVCNRGGEEDHG